MKIETKDLTLNQVNQMMYDYSEQGFDVHMKGRGDGEVYIEILNK